MMQLCYKGRRVSWKVWESHGRSPSAHHALKGQETHANSLAGSGLGLLKGEVHAQAGEIHAVKKGSTWQSSISTLKNCI